MKYSYINQYTLIIVIIIISIAITIINVTSIKKQLQKIEKKVGMEYQKAYKQG